MGQCLRQGGTADNVITIGQRRLQSTGFLTKMVQHQLHSSAVVRGCAPQNEGILCRAGPRVFCNVQLQSHQSQIYTLQITDLTLLYGTLPASSHTLASICSKTVSEKVRAPRLTVAIVKTATRTLCASKQSQSQKTFCVTRLNT